MNRSRRFRAPRFGEVADFAVWMMVVMAFAVAWLYVAGAVLNG